METEDLVIVKPAPFNAEAPLERLALDVTPNAHFYVRSNFAVPMLDPANHRIAVGGAVERKLSLALDDLRAMEQRRIATTMECAGNSRLSLVPLPTGEPWQAGAISTAEWSGVPLRTVLERAGLRSGVVEILVEGADHGTPKDGPGDIHFARSLPLEKALHDDTLLALEMNGEPLPAAHGAPVRLVVPAWYGMASVKWVSRIEALTQPFRGYYQVNRYIYDYGDGAPPAPVREMRVKSIIFSPLEGQTLPRGPAVVRGRAWSGVGEIVRVEVSVDGGDAWEEARLLGEARPYTWRAWAFEWDASEPGRHVLRARATDSAGNRQPDVARWNRYGYGGNAVRPVVVYVH
jgi:DMSO/TMAO reductase YedYZ molybdopterin-dependent catalytic subunit